MRDRLNEVGCWKMRNCERGVERGDVKSFLITTVRLTALVAVEQL